MCKQSANTQTVVQNPTIPDWLSTSFQNLATRAQGVSDRPYNPAVQRNVADFTPDQLQSFQQVRQDQGIYQPYMDAATGYAQIGGSPISAGQIANYSNPFQSQVIDATMANIQANNAIQANNLRGNAALQGGLGNDRLGVAQAELARNQNLATNQTLATLNAQNYNQALGAAQGDRSAAQNAASQFGNLGQNMQALAGRDSAALALQGATQQSLAQQQLDTTSANIAQQEQYPFATASWLGGMLQGASPSFTGSQSTTTSPGPSTLSQIAGLGMLGYGMFGPSDERLKENIEPIGEDFSGRTIYRFNFKGSPQTEIGYLAQEVAQSNPEAVATDKEGFLYVDYKDVTDDVVQPDREGFNSGGYTVGGTYTVDKNNIIRMSGGNQQTGQGTPYGSSNIVPQAAATQIASLYQPKKMPAPKSRSGQMYDEAKDIADDMRGMQQAGQGLAGMADQGMRGLGGVSMKPFSSYGPPVPEGLADGGRVGYFTGGLAGFGSFRGAQEAGMPTPYGVSNIVPTAPQPQARPVAGLGAAPMPAVPMDAQDGPGINPTMGLGAAAGSFRGAQEAGMPSDGGQTVAGAQGSDSLTGGGLFGGLASDPVRMAMVNAGLATLGGSSPHAMVNIGRGGLAGMGTYNQVVAAEQAKAQRAADEAHRKTLLDMRIAEFKAEQALREAESARRARFEPLEIEQRQAQIDAARRQAAEPGFERRQEIEREQAIKRVEAEREIKKREAIEAGYGPETPEYKAHVFEMKSGASRNIKEIDGKLYDMSGDAPKLVFDPKEADRGKLETNLMAGLEKLGKLPETYKSEFDTSVGSFEAGTMLGRGIASARNAFSKYGPGEVRSQIEADQATIAASIKPLIRGPGEGTWTDADQKKLDSIVGDLMGATDAKDFRRRLAGVRDRLNANFGMKLGRLSFEDAGKVPPEAVADLKKNPSPEMQAKFDEVFGSGAAKRALGGQ